MIFRQGELSGLGEELGATAAHAGEKLAVRAFEERILGITVGELGLEDDAGAVLVGERDGLPDTAGHGVLGRRIALDGDGRLIVLAEEVLHRIQEVLPHVAQTALVEVPVAAEGAVAAMRVIRDERRGAAIHVPVEVRRHRLGLELGLAGPEIDLPLDAADRREANRQRAAEDATGDDALDLASRADSVVIRPVEAEPGVHAERHAGLLDDAAQGDTLADRARQGLLAPDGLAAPGRHGGDDAVPVRRRADVDDVGIGQRDHFAEILGHDRGPAAGLLDAVELGFEVLGIDVTDTDDAVLAGHPRLGVHLGDAAATDDDVIQRLARRDETAAKHVTRDNREAKGGDGSLTQERTTGVSHEGCYEEKRPHSTMIVPPTDRMPLYGTIPPLKDPGVLLSKNIPTR